MAVGAVAVGVCEGAAGSSRSGSPSPRSDLRGARFDSKRWTQCAGGGDRELGQRRADRDGASPPHGVGRAHSGGGPPVPRAAGTRARAAPASPGTFPAARRHPGGSRPRGRAASRRRRLRRASLARTPGCPCCPARKLLAADRTTRRPRRPGRPPARTNRVRDREWNGRRSPIAPARSRARRGRRSTRARPAGLQVFRTCSPARRLGSERRLHRRRNLRPRLAAPALPCRPRAPDTRGDRLVRARGRLAAFGRSGRSRRRTRLTRLARCATPRPLALPRARGARPTALDAGEPPRAGVPALVRRRGGHLRRHPAGPALVGGIPGST